MAERLAADADPDRFGVKAMYLFGSTKNGTARPDSDIDLLVHADPTPEQRIALEAWLEGWSACLAEVNYLRTGHRRERHAHGPHRQQRATSRRRPATRRRSRLQRTRRGH